MALAVGCHDERLPYRKAYSTCIVVYLPVLGRHS